MAILNQITLGDPGYPGDGLATGTTHQIALEQFVIHPVVHLEPFYQQDLAVRLSVSIGYVASVRTSQTNSLPVGRAMPAQPANRPIRMKRSTSEPKCAIGGSYGYE